MARLIDVDKVINSMQKCLDESPDKKDSVAYFAFEALITALKQEPTVDAVPVVHGRWVPSMEEMEDGFGESHMIQTGVECSVCGQYSCCGGNFCKNCGANMDLEVKDA